MFNFFKRYRKDDLYIYKMLCKNCDIFFETKNPDKRKCPGCGQSKRVEVYSLINKETGKEFQ